MSVVSRPSSTHRLAHIRHHSPSLQKNPKNKGIRIWRMTRFIGNKSNETIHLVDH